MGNIGKLNRKLFGSRLRTVKDLVDKDCPIDNFDLPRHAYKFCRHRVGSAAHSEVACRGDSIASIFPNTAERWAP